MTTPRMAHAGVLEKPETDRIVFKIDWHDSMQLGIGQHMPVVDRIKSVAWVIDPDSPSTDVTLHDAGFDEGSATTWVAVSGGTAGQVVHMNCTIETTGGCVSGKNTPSQMMVRQMRFRVN